MSHPGTQRLSRRAATTSAHCQKANIRRIDGLLDRRWINATEFWTRRPVVAWARKAERDRPRSSAGFATHRLFGEDPCAADRHRDCCCLILRAACCCFASPTPEGPLRVESIGPRQGAPSSKEKPSKRRRYGSWRKRQAFTTASSAIRSVEGSPCWNCHLGSASWPTSASSSSGLRATSSSRSFGQTSKGIQ